MHDFPVFMFGFMILYKSCVEVVFGMSVENFTSELLKTWSLHLGGVLINFILQEGKSSTNGLISAILSLVTSFILHYYNSAR